MSVAIVVLIMSTFTSRAAAFQGSGATNGLRFRDDLEYVALPTQFAPSSARVYETVNNSSLLPKASLTSDYYSKHPGAWTSTLLGFPHQSGIIEFSAKVWQFEFESMSIKTRSNTDEYGWGGRFCLTMCILYVGVWYIWRSRQVECFADDDEMMVRLRGRPCWAYCCGSFLVFAGLLVFALTLAAVGEVNESSAQRYDHLHISNSGFRAYVAGMSVVLSSVAACYFLSSWRLDSAVKITASMMAQMAIRGTTFAIVLAMALEVYFGDLMDPITPHDDGFNHSTLLIMMMVGISEEAAKFGAIIAYTIYVAPRSEQDGESPHGVCDWISSSFTLAFRVLVESPKALALCGLAVGFGFMTGENVGYVMSVATQAPIVYDEGMSHGEARQIAHAQGLMTLIVRVIFNIHPWLSGLSAARLGSIAWRTASDKPLHKSATDVLVKDFIWCIWPAAVIHGLYDFAVSCGLGAWVLLVPPGCWYYSHRSFANSWRSLEAEAHAGK